MFSPDFVYFAVVAFAFAWVPAAAVLVFLQHNSYPLPTDTTPEESSGES